MAQQEQCLAHKSRFSSCIELFTSGDETDITFVFAYGEIRAHKQVLIERVPYFEKMFSSGMKESLTNRVDMPNVDMRSFDVFLRYIYGGHLPKSFDVESQLSYADMYDVPDLAKDCHPQLHQYLSGLPSLDNCVDVATRMAAAYKTESVSEGVKTVLCSELVKRIGAEKPAYKFGGPNVTLGGPYVICNSCAKEWARCQGACFSLKPASINRLVRIIIFSHSVNSSSLKEACYQHLASCKRKSQTRQHFEAGLKQLEEYPQLLREMATRFWSRF